MVTHRRGSDKAGFIYVTAIGTMLFITMLGASLLMRSTSELGISEQYRNFSEALHFAEAGVDQAARNLRTPPDPNNPTDPANPNNDPATTHGGYSTGSFQLDAPISLGNAIWSIIAHGESVRAPGIERQIEAVYQLTPQSVFQGALFADESLRVSGSAITDSYDAGNGLYNDDPSDPNYNHGHNGDVGTNSTAAGGVTVNGSIFIDGQVMVGPGMSSPETLVTGYDPAFITGGTSPPTDTQDVMSLSSEIPFPPVVVPSGCQTSLPSASKGTRTFLASVGNYCPSGSITINGGDVWTADGPVKVYLTDQLRINGHATVGVESDPKLMAFFMTSGATATVEEGTINGSAVFYGSIYGPNATINISGNAEIYGAVVAQTINVTGSAEIHYDESFQDCTQSPPPPSCEFSSIFNTALVSWREL